MRLSGSTDNTGFIYLYQHHTPVQTNYNALSRIFFLIFIDAEQACKWMKNTGCSHSVNGCSAP